MNDSNDEQFEEPKKETPAKKATPGTKKAESPVKVETPIEKATRGAKKAESPVEAEKPAEAEKPTRGGQRKAPEPKEEAIEPGGLPEVCRKSAGGLPEVCRRSAGGRPEVGRKCAKFK